MSSSGRSAALVAAVVAAIAAAGCGETVIDDAKAEDAIQQNVESAAGKKVTSVDCPAGVEVEKGETFECTVNLAGGGEETATMKILNEDADIELADLSPGG